VSESKGSVTTSNRGPSKEPRLGRIARIRRYFRQVAAELRKVVWPTRSQLLTYTGVVIVFVTLFAVFILLADLGFAKLVNLVFGN
jgi:preprotein translocase subunit SecE